VSIPVNLDDVQATTSYEEEVAALQEYQAESQNAISAEEGFFIDPQLLALEKQSRNESAPVDDTANTDATLLPEAAQRTLRLRQVMASRDMINSCPRPTIADGVFERVTEGSLRHEDVDTILLALLSVKHSLTRYPAHLMPVLGTKNCSFCGVPWDDWVIANPDEKYASRFVHVKQCARSAALARADSELGEALEAAFIANGKKCPWVPGRPSGPCPVTNFRDAAAWAAHLAAHRKSSKDVCRIDKCGTCLTSPGVWRAHAWEKHQIPMDGVSDGIVQWCDWCEDWVIITPGSDHEVSHFSNHLEHAINLVKEYGYGGCHDGMRPLVPEKCIFCLHNPEIAAKDRLFFPLSPENRLNHIQNHLKSKEAAVVEVVPPIRQYLPLINERPIGQWKGYCRTGGPIGQ